MYDTSIRTACFAPNARSTSLHCQRVDSLPRVCAVCQGPTMREVARSTATMFCVLCVLLWVLATRPAARLDVRCGGPRLSAATTSNTAS